MGKSLFQLGTIRLVLEDYKEALDYFNKAKNILDLHYQDKGGLDKAIQSMFHNNFGVIFSGLQAYDKAALEFKTGIELIATDTLLQHSKIQLINNLGDVYCKSEAFEKAITQYEIALNLLKEYPNPLFEAMVHHGMGKTYLASKNYSEALHHFRIGMAIAKKANGISVLKHINQGMANTFELLNKKDSAFVYIQASKSYEDSLKIKKTSEKMLQSELLAEFDKEKKSLTVHWTYYKNIFTMIITSLFGILLLLYFRFKFQKRKITKLNQENQEIGQMARSSEMEKETLKETLKEKITENDKKLALISMKNLQKEAFIDLVSKKLPNTDAPLHQQNLEQIQQSLKSLQSSKGLHDFECYFEGLYIGFFEKLQERHPNLTANERRLCAFLKLQMNSKEIANVTGQSVRAVEIARTRLRKKLGISKADVLLNDFFVEF
jgi:tetratricopeptide (TPR) repeat protein